jgi:hypothetical protein
MPSASELRQTAEQPLDLSVPQTYELRERQQEEQPAHDNRPKEATNAPTNEDYEPNPANSIKLEPERQHILDSIVRLYSGSGKNDDAATGDQDIRVYAKKSVYDDIASCKSGRCIQYHHNIRKLTNLTQTATPATRLQANGGASQRS